MTIDIKTKYKQATCEGFYELCFKDSTLNKSENIECSSVMQLGLLAIIDAIKYSSSINNNERIVITTTNYHIVKNFNSGLLYWSKNKWKTKKKKVPMDLPLWKEINKLKKTNSIIIIKRDCEGGIN